MVCCTKKTISDKSNLISIQLIHNYSANYEQLVLKKIKSDVMVKLLGIFITLVEFQTLILAF